MDTSKISIILRAVELGSLTKAADEFGYSPSAISQMVNALEKEIGTKLIKREYTGVLIEDGKEEIFDLLKVLVSTSREIAEIVEKTENSKIGKKPNITVVTYASISKLVMTEAIKSFKKMYPHVDIHIIVSDNLGEVYRKEKVDLIFGERYKNKECVWNLILTDPYVAVFPEMQEYSSDEITREELLKITFIMAKDMTITNYIKKCITEDTVINNSNDDSSVIEFVKSGMCVSILPKLAVRNVSGIKFAMLIPPLKRDLGFTYNKKNYENNKYLRKFTEHLEKYIKENIM